jgi:addiction module HigA family antidote
MLRADSDTARSVRRSQDDRARLRGLDPRTCHTNKGIRPVHPGEILLDEFMKPSDPPLSANALARALDVPANRITAIIKGQRGITGETAVRLATFFNTTLSFG